MALAVFNSANNRTSQALCENKTLGKNAGVANGAARMSIFVKLRRCRRMNKE